MPLETGENCSPLRQRRARKRQATSCSKPPALTSRGEQDKRTATRSGQKATSHQPGALEVGTRDGNSGRIAVLRESVIGFIIGKVLVNVFIIPWNSAKFLQRKKFLQSLDTGGVVPELEY